MHWFWRAAIASGVGGCCYAIMFAGMIVEIPGLTKVDMVLRTLLGSIVTLLPSFVVAVVFHRLTIRFAPNPAPETRCRKCHYILRGITKPRCPECRERI